MKSTISQLKSNKANKVTLASSSTSVRLFWPLPLLRFFTLWTFIVQNEKNKLTTVINIIGNETRVKETQVPHRQRRACY